jgi:hypothetical protein
MLCCEQKLLCGRFPQFIIYHGYCSYVHSTVTDLPLSCYVFEQLTVLLYNYALLRVLHTGTRAWEGMCTYVVQNSEISSFYVHT